MLTMKPVVSRETNKICASKKIIYRQCQGIPYEKGLTKGLTKIPIQDNVIIKQPKSYNYKYAQLYNNPAYLFNPRFYNIYTYFL